MWLKSYDGSQGEQSEEQFFEVISSIVQWYMAEMEKRRNAKERQERRARLRQTGIPSLRGNTLVGTDKPSGTEDKCPLAVPQEAEKKEEKKDAQEQAQSGPDSIQLAKALRFIAKMDGRHLNMSQVQLLLYIAYGVYLAKRGSRIIPEQPQAWVFGPVFPRAYNRLRKDNGDGKEEFVALSKDRPDILSLLQHTFRRFGFRSAAAIGEPHTDSKSPWGLTCKANPEKWGATIDDELIGKWFGSMLETEKK